MKYDIVGSIVLYRNDPAIVKKSIESFLNTRLRVKLYLIDNSPTDKLKNELASYTGIDYIFNNDNVGFGKGHNISIRKSIDDAPYHLVFNPDIFFPQGTLEELFQYGSQHPEVGLILPKVYSFGSEMQYLCKRLPAPFELIVRRFLPSTKVAKDSLFYYEMRDKNYNEIFEAPSLSGCFMFLRSEALKKVGLFDERYFIYMEDIDLSRRIAMQFKTIYFPHVHIYHGHARESYGFNKLLLLHIHSAIKYFNKWGWFFDKNRRAINKKV
jgi:GT2 family glycosyltransferase